MWSTQATARWMRFIRRMSRRVDEVIRLLGPATGMSLLRK